MTYDVKLRNISFIEKIATFTSNEEVINAYQSEPVLWDTVLNATRRRKSWHGGDCATCFFLKAPVSR